MIAANSCAVKSSNFTKTKYCMRTSIILLLALCCSADVFSQKKPLDHSVYDGWQSIGEKYISNNGKWVVYTINPQEGDGVLVIQASDNSYKKEIPRGYNAVITDDSRFVVCRIRPLFKDTRDARIKKKTPDQMPKDSLAINECGRDSVLKIARVKSYKTPEKAGGWVAYLSEKAMPETGKPATPDSLTRLNNMIHIADSLARLADSLRNKAGEAKLKGMTVLQQPKKENKPAAKTDDPVEEGTELTLKNLLTGEEKKFKLVSDYYFSKKGNVFIIETTKKNNDAGSVAAVLWTDPASGKIDTVMKRFNDAKNYAIDEDGQQLAFVAERDSAAKSLKKFYSLWYYKPGMDSAQLKANKSTAGIPNGFTVSADYNNSFSRDGNKLYSAIAPIRPPKDTTLVEFETARLDIWNYKDDYLQPQQLVTLNNDLRKSYTMVLKPADNKLTVLSDENCENIQLADEGNAMYALGSSTKGYRVQQQWEQSGLQKLYLVNTEDGTRKLVQDKVRGFASISPKGKFILWYDWKKKNWFTYNISNGAIANITAAVKVPLFDEEDDHPDDPPPHGAMGWLEDDKYVLVYDKYDVWKCDPSGKEAPQNFTNGVGRKNKMSYRFINLDRENRFIKNDLPVYFSVFDEASKKNGVAGSLQGKTGMPNIITLSPNNYTGFVKAKNAPQVVFTKESFSESPDLCVMNTGSDFSMANLVKLSSINPQQKDYNWMTAELLHWKMFDGRMSEGILYKPENFDSTKKYPVIFYFYERDADNLYDYIVPQPVRASVNIPYFVSNGYLVFDPNIYYKTGQPGEDAYNSVISAAKFLGKYKWVDTLHMAIQGHSWGGYQVAYLVTRTNMFAAAEAGAPVANMTSAYGGIRWGTGISRQFQYEHSQSRLGASLWQNPQLFIKNSPLFRADKVQTPLLMMHNDADGAVPWYQGIEYFTALKRLGKKVWMMQYNGEDHGLLERRNRKDWSIRLGQFFGYYLKGDKPARWITEGVPATLKGIDWGLGN